MRTEESRERYRQSKLGIKNPMYGKHPVGEFKKGMIPWNKGLTGEELRKHYKNGIMKGGRLKGYKHTEESKKRMSKNTLGKKHPNYNPSIEVRNMAAERMKKNRNNFEFNKKMFSSLQRCYTNPHRKVKSMLIDIGINTYSNYPILIGNKYAEIDEADIERKIAIFVDGNYWHNYPNLRKWDKTVNTCLKNKGWKVYRFWESDIKQFPERIFDIIKKIK